ncbi:MAG: DEAD/DEAH box helicase [Oligoflexales bacterium]|nr:DEAD/DEAH box helicase [Oligoflexales bacterium]
MKAKKRKQREDQAPPARHNHHAPVKSRVKTEPRVDRRPPHESPSPNRPHQARHEHRGHPARGRFRGEQQVDDSQGHPRQLNATLVKALEKTRQSLQLWFAESKKLHESSPHRADRFELDPWQEEALEALEERSNVVVDAPTSAGKTRIIETFFARNIHDPRFRACYTCPVKSLSNDKVKEFRELFGADKVGIATGDIKENLDAPLVVATLETYRNSLLGTEPDLGRSLVVFDEYHYLQDESRGSAWEESMILTPASCQILLLSASITNPEDFAQWLETLSGRASRLIQVSERPVPLVDLAWYESAWFVPEHLPRSIVHRRAPAPFSVLNPKTLCTRIVQLDALNLTPCIVYAGKRASCEQLARELTRQLQRLPAKASLDIQNSLKETDATYPCLNFMDAPLRSMIEHYGVAYHHSGHPPSIRIAIENLLKNGLIRFCTATMGLSLGINFSVRSALISDVARPSEKGMVPYTASELLQMRGRAGRRGRDAVGFSLWPDLGAYTKSQRAKRKSCDSQLKSDPATFLGLIGRGFSLGQIEQFYKKSFLKFQNPDTPLSVISKNRVEKTMGAAIPCQSPSHEYSAFQSRKIQSLCQDCEFRINCHSYQRSLSASPLTGILHHLHNIGALDERDQLTPYGDIARLLPQGGGLLVAKMLDEGLINDKNLLATAQLIAALSLAGHKSPNVPESYKLPFDSELIETRLEYFYPLELFPDVYDAPRGRRAFHVFRDLNPSAGFIIKEWAHGGSWDDLTAIVANEQFGDGDIIHLIYRVASFLQSFSRVPDPVLSETALELRDFFLREPVRFLI